MENNVAIACVTETWLDGTIPVELSTVEGYTTHRNDRKSGKWGGEVAVFVRQDVPCMRLSRLERDDVESVWLIYRQPRMPRVLSHIIIGAIYHPPSADDKIMTAHIIDCIDDITKDHPHAGIVLLGDFNRLRDAALLTYPLRQVVRSPTRGEAILDKIYTNLYEWYGRPEILPSIGCF